MTVVRNIPLSISLAEVTKISSLRCQGLCGPKIMKILPAVLDHMLEQALFEPKFSYVVNAVAKAPSEGRGLLVLENGVEIESPLVAHKLHGASEIAIGFLTIGSTMGNYITSLIKEGSNLKALIADGIANCALFKLQNIYRDRISQEAAQKGHKASGILNPGDDGFDLSLQADLFALAGGRDMGMKMTSAGMINPHHSLSAVIGIGPNMKEWSQADNCGNCAAKTSCRYRDTSAETMA